MHYVNNKDCSWQDCSVFNCYLSHCYTIDGTDYQISFCVSVYCVGTPTVAFFNESSRNLAGTLGSEKEELIMLG